MPFLRTFPYTIFALSFAWAAVANAQTLFEKALACKADLQLSVYATEDSVHAFAASAASREEAVTLLKKHGITKIFLEVYRGGIVPPADLITVRDYFLSQSIEVSGGIATLPGDGHGVRENAKLGWFNYEAPETQQVLKDVMRSTAPIFDEFIVDDFLCTGDTSDMSVTAKGDRSWSEYRRELLTKTSIESLIAPSKEANPLQTLIIKYPQWYDRFHEFGYELARQPQLFDKVWVGTETRGATTQRFGFTQPYMGFVNLRWITSIAGDKVLGGWFDHGDCDADDFIEQAFQTVLAGARQLMIFSYGAFPNGGHPGHPRLIEEFENLVELARAVRSHPVTGIHAYKPVNSDTGGDLFIMDYIGMLGVPLVPVSTLPATSPCVFLPAQAAADPRIVEKITLLHARGVPIVMTASLLAKLKDAPAIYALAGIAAPFTSAPVRAQKVGVGTTATNDVAQGLDIEGDLQLNGAEVLVTATVDGRAVPFFTKHAGQGAPVYVLNTHTFSQADYDAVGEVLLPPRDLGFSHLPQDVTTVIRAAFTEPMGIALAAPINVTIQPLDGAGVVIHNYNRAPVTVSVTASPSLVGVRNAWTTAMGTTGASVTLEMPARSRVWLNGK